MLPRQLFLPLCTFNLSHKMRVCVVGAGAAGLVSAKHLSQNSIDFDIFEKADRLGGVWVYTEDKDEAHQTPMYKSLRTNLPKQLMTFEGHTYGTTDSSYIRHELVLKYLQEYADMFKITDKIKFQHCVKNISFDQDKWKVVVDNKSKREEETIIYDSVFVCNGHFSKEKYPALDGSNDFKGFTMHSKMYRKPDIFKGKSVLVIGYGPSGQDITMDISSCAQKVFLSTHDEKFKQEFFPNNVIKKPDVSRLNENSVSFEDGTEESIDAVFYCTGYFYSFPFLDATCGITIEDGYVKPLYKHIVNINHPSMYFIGLPFRTFILPMFEIQAKASINLLLKKCALPSCETMMRELESFENGKSSSGQPKRKYLMIDSVEDYIEGVRKIGDLEPVPKVYYKLYHDSAVKRKTMLNAYRFYDYTIIDGDSFAIKYFGTI